jgi:hypothetical protein
MFDTTHTFFAMLFVVWDQQLDVSKSGLFIKFNDGSILRLPNQIIHAGNQHGNLGYSYTTSLKVTKNNIKKLTSKYIVKFGLGDIKEQDVPEKWGIKYMHYISCIQKLK